MNPTAKPCELTQIADCRDFFQQMILSGLSYWQDHAALQNMDVPILDKERDGILHALSHGLDFDQAWPLAQKLIKALASYMERRGYWTAWRSVLEQAIATSQRVGDLAGETTMTALLARLSQRQSRGADVVRYYRRAMRLAKQSDNQYEYARACCNLGYYYIDAFRWWRAEVLSLRALAIFEALGSEHGLAHTCNHLGFLYAQQQQWKKSEANLMRACNIWRTHNDMHSLIYGLVNLGGLYNSREMSSKAVSTLAEALSWAETTSEKQLIANILNNLAIANRQQGSYAEAELLISRAEAILVKYSDNLELARVWHNMGLIQLDKGQRLSAKGYLERSLQTFCQLNNEYGIEQVTADMNKLNLT